MKKNDEKAASRSLQILAMKVKGLAHLIELQGLAEGPPEDPEEVFHGISLTLMEISESIKKVSNHLEGTN